MVDCIINTVNKTKVDEDMGHFQSTPVSQNNYMNDDIRVPIVSRTVYQPRIIYKQFIYCLQW